ncbi:Fur family transcriptional regulator [Conexibacter sp. JD483]|uniref:Fur family transcriptional regulator n=1 Tax=unclassified Conexibacter TaxID=2627773 RepID=UPI0027182C7D|nr:MULTISPECIES: Fur family transcriptional regulator [unclassified Conexibacter]MDO8187621.1 Fur family transcriptional regulator [Conexibacter sp. CPCC 205706]MDO8201047.1 Fur family transcriptional regulator [Conexibacter sp. CPCC 205762]MDR9371220.1 Fur family transcriptional regulator [Conexibacter sp. JD483]
MDVDVAEQRLRSAGLRVTASRAAVLGVLAASADHPRVDQLIERVRARGVSMSKQAAYDVCEALRTAGLAQRIALPGAPARWEARTGDNHHHLVCRVCGETHDVDCATGRAPCLDPATAPPGFRLDEVEVTYWGVCSGCRATDHPPREDTTDER